MVGVARIQNDHQEPALHSCQRLQRGSQLLLTLATRQVDQVPATTKGPGVDRFHGAYDRIHLERCQKPPGLARKGWWGKNLQCHNTSVSDTQFCVNTHYFVFVRALGRRPLDIDRYLIATTIESGPTRGSTRVDEKPASFIHPEQSAPV